MMTVGTCYALIASSGKMDALVIANELKKKEKELRDHANRNCKSKKRDQIRMSKRSGR